MWNQPVWYAGNILHGTQISCRRSLGQEKLSSTYIPTYFSMAFVSTAFIISVGGLIVVFFLIVISIFRYLLNI